MKNALTNLELSYPRTTDLLMKGAIAVAHSLIPGALSAVDKMMEETFMKFAKLAGIIRFFVLIVLGLKYNIKSNSNNGRYCGMAVLYQQIAMFHVFQVDCLDCSTCL